MIANRRGVALMLVLWIIVVLAVVCAGVAAATRQHGNVAGNYRARATARYAAESALNLATATVEQQLELFSDSLQRRNYLNNLERALGSNATIELGDAHAGAVLVDVGARVDVNAADVASLAKLFSFFTTPTEAQRAAAAINTFIGGDVTQLDQPMLQVAKPLKSLDELDRIPGLSHTLVERAAPYLTVDGDGTINRVTASDTVRAAAGGELRDEPSRILIVSRGWQNGHPLTHEIQGVYGLAGNRLVLMRWRERDL
jgi:general secretion pathway protein K